MFLSRNVNSLLVGAIVVRVAGVMALSLVPHVVGMSHLVWVLFDGEVGISGHKVPVKRRTLAF